MAENTEPSEPEAIAETSVAFGFTTPAGMLRVDHPSDLPREVRDLMLQNIRNAEGMPEEIRAVFIDALTGDGDQAAPEDSPVVPDAVAGEDAPVDGHEAGCDCSTRHRQDLWALLDSAFPDDPHLWQAAEALFSISEKNPQEIDDTIRREALEKASLHIQHRAELAAPVLSPVEQIIAAFRDQMGR